MKKERAFKRKFDLKKRQLKEYLDFHINYRRKDYSNDRIQAHIDTIIGIELEKHNSQKSELDVINDLKTIYTSKLLKTIKAKQAQFKAIWLFIFLIVSLIIVNIYPEEILFILPLLISVALAYNIFYAYETGNKLVKSYRYAEKFLNDLTIYPKKRFVYLKKIKENIHEDPKYIVKINLTQSLIIKIYQIITDLNLIEYSSEYDNMSLIARKLNKHVVDHDGKPIIDFNKRLSEQRKRDHQTHKRLIIPILKHADKPLELLDEIYEEIGKKDRKSTN